jgi:glutaredoxin
MSIWQRMLGTLRRRPEPPVSVPVTLYTRSGCHLCDEALELLRSSARSAQFLPEPELIDIDQDPELVALYGDKVPVLALGGKVRLWGKINPVLLRRALEGEAKRLRKEASSPRPLN